MSNAFGSPNRKTRVLVVGAGAFGGWTALHLQRRGVQVTLCDAWGPGNSRASSGGETRIIRATYGPDRPYVQMAVRALELWKEHEKRWNLKLFHHTGVLWMAGADDHYEKAALPLLREASVRFEELTTAAAAKRFPQINFEGVRWALYEQDFGFLTARRNCQTVMEHFVNEGGEYRQLAAQPAEISGGELQGVKLSDGSVLRTEQYIFACGPWLKQIFPEVLGDRINVTRQEVYFFGPPAGDARFAEDVLPAFVDNTGPHFYGVASNLWRGFKLAYDVNGPQFDPTSGDRTPNFHDIQIVRDRLGFRFPGMKNAPLLEARVCQYEDTADENFIVDRHPRAGNLLLLGGGSGHGFKHGPAVGEMVSKMVLGEEKMNRQFGLARFSKS